MITYLWLKEFIKNADDYSDLMQSFIIMPFAILFDILFIIFQPFMYLVYKVWQKENEEE